MANTDFKEILDFTYSLYFKSGFAEMFAGDAESLKEAADLLNEKHRDALNDIMDLRDKKLEEIEDAYEKNRVFPIND